MKKSLCFIFCFFIFQVCRAQSKNDNLSLFGYIINYNDSLINIESHIISNNDSIVVLENDYDPCINFEYYLCQTCYLLFKFDNGCKEFKRYNPRYVELGETYDTPKKIKLKKGMEYIQNHQFEYPYEKGVYKLVIKFSFGYSGKMIINRDVYSDPIYFKN